MSPHARRLFAAVNVCVWGILTLPVTIWVPMLDEAWFERAVLFLSCVALIIPALDVWATTDVRAEQDVDAGTD